MIILISNYDSKWGYLGADGDSPVGFWAFMAPPLTVYFAWLLLHTALSLAFQRRATAARWLSVYEFHLSSNEARVTTVMETRSFP